MFEKIEAGFAVFKKISTFAALSGETRTQNRYAGKLLGKTSIYVPEVT